MALALPNPPGCQRAPDKSLHRLVNDDHDRARHGNTDGDSVRSMPVHPNCASKQEHQNAPEKDEYGMPQGNSEASRSWFLLIHILPPEKAKYAAPRTRCGVVRD